MQRIKEKEVRKLEQTVHDQGKIMDGLSVKVGEELLKLWKLRGDI